MEKLKTFYQEDRMMAIKNESISATGLLSATIVGYADGGFTSDGKPIFSRIEASTLYASGSWTIIGFYGVFRDDLKD